MENVLTSRVMDPIKALGRTGMLGGFVNKFDGGVEILDDLDDHWTAKHHKAERNWFIQELQELAADKSVRVTILGGDVHLAAVGQFYSNKRLGIPKDRDHRYMPNVISSAIVNTPPPELMADILNKRNKVHHLDEETDEDMIPMFTHDVDGKPRNNHHLLPRRNWCSIREYTPGTTPPPTPPTQTPSPDIQPPKLTRSLSLTRKDFRPGNLVRRFSKREKGPPVAFYNRDSPQSGRRGSSSGDFQGQRPGSSTSQVPSGYHTPQHAATQPMGSVNRSTDSHPSTRQAAPIADPPRPNPFHRRPTGLSIKAARKGGGFDADDDDDSDAAGAIDLRYGLDVVLNLEVSQKDPAGITTPYRLLVPALRYDGAGDENVIVRKPTSSGGLKSFFGMRRKKRADFEDDPYYDSRSPSPTASEEAAIEQLSGRGSVVRGGGGGDGAFGGDGHGHGRTPPQQMYVQRGGSGSGSRQGGAPPAVYDSPPPPPQSQPRASMQQTRPLPPVQYGSDPVQSNRRPPQPPPPNLGPLPSGGVPVADSRRYYNAPEPVSPMRDSGGGRAGGGGRRGSRFSDQYYDDVSDEEDSLGSFSRERVVEEEERGKGPVKKKAGWKIWR